jgi:hypothetical protein
MKARLFISSVFLIGCLVPIRMRAQGSLTPPPGVPGPTMKSLDQIEPRIPISSTPFIITSSGSYYLTTNLHVTNGDAIDIDTNQVTLDLNGFTISSSDPGASAYAILLAVPGGNSNVTIFNGHIVSGVTYNGTNFIGPGFGHGIDLPGSTVQNVRVSDVSVSGCSYFGIYLGTGDSSVVESCNALNIGSTGILASSVLHSTAYQCGTTGIYADVASDCSGHAIAGGVGVQASTANNCQGSCTGSGTGLLVTGVAIGCYGQSASGVGINAHIANSCFVGGGATNITYKYNMP